MKSIYYYLTVLLFCMASCGKDRYQVPLNDAPAPLGLKSVTVQNLSGAADIFYTTPNDGNILYVKAIFTLKDGTKGEARSSVYNNRVHVEGFADTLSHDVQLFVVGRNEKSSEGFTVKIKPTLPPYLVTRKSLTMQSTFGGIHVKYLNPSKGNLSLNIMVDSSNVWIPVFTHYTKIDSGFFSVRGLPETLKKYAIFVKDRWNNHSDTLTQLIEPIFEEVIPKTTFKQMRFPGELWEVHPSQVGVWEMPRLWDGGYNDVFNVFHTNPKGKLPYWFSFDMGVKAKLSRFKLYSRVNNTSVLTYVGGDPLHYEIWGSNDPNPDGSFDSWTKLTDVTSIKPSGSPLGVNTSDDLYYAVMNGQEFDFPVDIPAVRYLRFKIIDTWGSTDYFYISELSFWGQRE